MDLLYSNTVISERKRGTHLSLVEYGEIEQFQRLGYSNRAIAGELNCSLSTIGYELKRGTKSYKGRNRKAVYSARRAQNTYQQNRAKCHRSRAGFSCPKFYRWLSAMIYVESYLQKLASVMQNLHQSSN